jgi:hypothetical protein
LVLKHRNEIIHQSDDVPFAQKRTQIATPRSSIPAL